MKELSTNILEQAASCFKNARKSIFEGTRLLYQIRDQSLYLERFSSFSEYVEQECQLSKGYVSKLLQVYEYYVIQNGVSRAKLSDTDPETLYLSLKLSTGSPQQRLVKAKEWTREDFRDELASGPDGDCKHENTIEICTRCKQRVK